MKQAMIGTRIGIGALLLLGFAIAHAKNAAAQSQSQSAPDSTTPSTAPSASAESQSAPSASPTLPEDWVKALNWRCIGPANMGGRITAIAVNENDPCTWWIATASGGLLKTMNSGFSFENQFDRESTVSIGAVAVAPSNPDIVWVGTGEANPRNSVSWGDGVYKSTDGGKTWTNMGLKNSFQIGQIAIDPTNADIVYVGALGRLWGPNEERGLFKTADGGKTWEKVLYIDDKTGVIDVQLQPGSPNTVLAATYERLRDRYDSNEPIKPTGPGAGIHKSTDGGKTWKKLAQGLPTSNLGRIGLNWYRKDPNIVYAIIESERIGQEPENAPFAGLTGEDADVGARISNITGGGPADHAGLKVGDIVVRLNETTIHSYDELIKEMRKHVAGDTVKIEVSRDRKSVVVDVTFDKRPEAKEDQPPPQAETPAEGAPAAAPAGGEQPPGESASPSGEQRAGAGPRRGPRGGSQSQPASSQPARARTPFAGGLGGQRENIHDQQGPNGFEFGGVFMSTDAGETWKRINSINPRPMYFSEVRVDPSDNNYLWVLGISLYRSKDAGATFTDDGGNDAHADHHAMWIDPKDGRHIILGNDGGLYVTCDRGEHWDHLNHMAIGQFYHVAVDSRPNYRVYGGLQDNGSWGGPSRVRDGAGPINEDWISIGGGDGFVSFVDAEDPDQVYFCSQNGGMGARNLRTGDGWGIRPQGRRGVRYRWNWRTPYILSSHNSRIFYAAANYVFRSLDRGRELKPISQDITNTDKGSATALAESPRDADVLYVGTDDGAFWMTRNGGHDWINLFDPPADDQQDGASSQPGGPGGGESRGRRGGPGGPGGRGNRGISAEALRRMDANGNGSIERDEVPERMQQMFARLDRNGDGVIDSSEIEAAGNRAAQTQPAPQPPPGEKGVEDANVQPTAATQPGAATQPVPPLPTTAPASQPQVPPPATEPAAPAASQPATSPATTAPATDDPVTGTWEGQVISDQLPPEQSKFSFSVKLEAGDKVSGSITTAFNQGDLTGTFSPASKRVTLSFESPFRTVEYTGTINGTKMTGEANAGEGAFTFNFEANRINREVAATPAEREAAPKPEGKPIKELLPGLRYVSSIEPSRVAAGRVYVTFDGHRSNDDEPYVFVSEDFGRHWRSIRANLPTSAGSTKCIREDIVNRDILYLGAEFGAWISIDRGASWTKFNGNMPTVAVHDFAMHPTAGEIVAATHGRSLWVLDVTPIRQMKSEMLAQKASLFKPNEAIYWRSEPRHGGGTRRYVGQNPNNNASVYYCLTKPNQHVSLKVTTQAGETLRELEASADPGLHRAEWDLRRQPQGGPNGQGGPGARAPNAARALGAGGGGGGRFGRRGQLVPAGVYRVVLSVDDVTFGQDLVVETDPEHTDYRPWETEEQQLEFEQMFEEHDDDAGALNDPDKGIGD